MDIVCGLDIAFISFFLTGLCFAIKNRFMLCKSCEMRENLNRVENEWSNIDNSVTLVSKQRLVTIIVREAMVYLVLVLC